MVCQRTKKTSCTKGTRCAKNNLSNRKPKILVVEDTKPSQDAASAILKELMCDVDVASDGNQALEMVEQQPYDLILMDIGLPDVDGITVSETIRFLEQKRKTPIIALTVFEGKDMKTSCSKCGMNHFLEKPLTMEKAKQLLKKFQLLPS